MLTQRALMQSGEAASASSHSLTSGEGEYKKHGDSGLGTQEPTSLSPEAPGAEGYRCAASGLESNLATTGWLCEPGQVA